jgi:hypothetical protein
MDEFKVGDLVWYDFRKVAISLGAGEFCIVRGTFNEYVLLVYEDEADTIDLQYRFVANPIHLVRIDPDTPQNRLAMRLKYSS